MRARFTLLLFSVVKRVDKLFNNDRYDLYVFEWNIPICIQHIRAALSDVSYAPYS